MPSYLSADGSRFTLAVYDLETWAAHTREHLIRLGCSETYAERRAKLIREAKKL